MRVHRPRPLDAAQVLRRHGLLRDLRGRSLASRRALGLARRGPAQRRCVRDARRGGGATRSLGRARCRGGLPAAARPERPRAHRAARPRGRAAALRAGLAAHRSRSPGHWRRYSRAMNLSTQIDLVLDGRRLLSHPFYRRWEAGELGDGELAAYASQYEHFERQPPRTLEAIIEACEPGEARDVIQSSLDDELGAPRAHVELLGSFLDAVGAAPAPPPQATPPRLA